MTHRHPIEMLPIVGLLATLGRARPEHLMFGWRPDVAGLFSWLSAVRLAEERPPIVERSRTSHEVAAEPVTSLEAPS